MWAAQSKLSSDFPQPFETNTISLPFSTQRPPPRTCSTFTTRDALRTQYNAMHNTQLKDQGASEVTET